MKEDLRIKRTYKLLTDSLMELMTRKPFDKITVVDICKNAMVHRATFYAHFEDKYQLLQYIMETFNEPFDKVDVTAHDLEGYKKYYISVATEFISALADKKDIMRAVMKKNREDSLMNSVQRAFTEKIYEKLKKCAENGMTLPVPAEVLAGFYGGGCISVLEWWIEGEREIPKEKLSEYLDKLISVKL